MRLFVALTPPQSVVDQLASLVDAVRPESPDLSWTPPEAWHLTLAFLGEVGADLLPELRERLGRTARRHQKMALTFTGAGRFGDRVLWVGVQGDRVALRRLAGSVAAACRRTGIVVGERPYHPHLTLARARRPTDLRQLVAALAGYTGSPWTAGAIHLVRSRLGAGPGRTSQYETVVSWSLAHG